jgi:hypothetical protein
MRTLPAIVTKLTHGLDAWIVGSPANPENQNPRDYDLIVPYHKWNEATMIMPKDGTLNTFGGYKFVDENNTIVDVWPGDMWWILKSTQKKFVWHPRTGTRWSKTNGNG